MWVALFLVSFHPLYAIGPTPASPPETYWEGAGDTLSMSAYGQGGRYLRFTHFPVKVYLNRAKDTGWQNALDNAIDQLAAIVPLEQTPSPFGADLIILVLAPERFEQISPCNGHLKDGCSLMRPIGLPEDAGFRLMSWVWLRQDSLLPAQHLILHEVIHALGLLVHSPYPEDVMYNGQDRAVIQLSDRDRATLAFLYQQPAWGD